MTETNATPSVFANEDSFRAELAKINEAPEDLSASSVPEDVQEVQKTDSDDSNESVEQEESQDDAERQQETEAHQSQEKGHLIPKSRFNQELERRKAAEEQAIKEREERIRIETQLQMLTEMQKAQYEQQLQQQPHEPDIDPLDTDTYNYAKREIDALKAQLAQVSQDNMQQAQQMYAVNRVQMEERQFQQQHPDFNDALKHVQQVELNIAKDLIGDEVKANEYVAQKMRNVLTQSLDMGKNSAETIYNMAKTYGYVPNKISTQTVSGKNINSISKNMERSANTSGLGNNSSFGNIPTDISSAVNKVGNNLSGINPDAFHKILARLQ